MDDEQAYKIINKVMSSDEWKTDIARFPKEWQTQVELVMAKALGHGIYATREAANAKKRSEAEVKAFRDEQYRQHLENYRRETMENGGIPIRLGIDTP